MKESQLRSGLDTLANTARELGYTVTTPELFIDPVHGKTSNYGRASAVYFTADQVEANEERG